MKNQSTVLYVNPVKRISVQGRDKQVYMIINPNTGDVNPTAGMGKTKESTVAEEFSFPYNPDKQRLETGLDVPVLNPFQNDDAQSIMAKYSLPIEWLDILKDIIKKEKINKQLYYEILGGVKPGHYTSEVANTIFNMPSGPLPAPTFMQGFSVLLYDRPNRFEDDYTAASSRSRLAIQLIKTHPKIAKSKNEANSAYHSWYISEENEAEKERNIKKKVINKATYHLFKLQNEFSPYKNYQVAVLLKDHLDNSIITTDVSPNKVEDALNNYLDRTGDAQMDHINKFMNIMDLLATPDGVEKFHIQYLLRQAINSNVIAVRDGYYVWHSKAGVNDNIYKVAHLDKLLELLIKEYRVFNPKEDEVTNWYGELVSELQAKNIWIENV